MRGRKPPRRRTAGQRVRGCRDAERQGIGKITYRFSRDEEEETEPMILAVPLEGIFFVLDSYVYLYKVIYLSG